MGGRRRRGCGRYTPPKRVLYIGPELSEDLPPRAREGIARRRLVATTGRCPCGAQLEVPDGALRPGAVAVVAVEHEADCPAVDQ